MTLAKGPGGADSRDLGTLVPGALGAIEGVVTDGAVPVAGGMVVLAVTRPEAPKSSGT